MFQESGLRDTLFLVHLSVTSVQHWCFVHYCFLFFPFRALTERKVERKHSFCTNAHQDIPLHIKPSNPNTSANKYKTKVQGACRPAVSHFNCRYNSVFVRVNL